MRVAVAEDSVLLREGIARLLTDAGFDVTARCGDARELRAELRVAVPDVVIVDIRLPPTHTDEGCARRSSCGPRTRAWRCWCCRSTSRWVSP